MNLYTDLEAFRREYVQGAALDTNDQIQALATIEDASRAVDDFLNFDAFPATATRLYDGNGKTELQLPDPVLSVTKLQYDSDADHTVDTELTENTDFWLWPDNESPKWRLDVHPESTELSFWPARRKAIEIQGIFGYSQDTEATGAAIAEGGQFSASDTTLTVDNGGLFAVGQTILIDSEQMYISAISGNDLTVTRGVNGTTAATHADGTAISRYVYTSQIAKAALIQAGRFWKRRETSYATTIVNPLAGTMEVFRGLDPDVARLLNPIRDRAVLA